MEKKQTSDHIYLMKIEDILVIDPKTENNYFKINSIRDVRFSGFPKIDPSTLPTGLFDILLKQKIEPTKQTKLNALYDKLIKYLVVHIGLENYELNCAQLDRSLKIPSAIKGNYQSLLGEFYFLKPEPNSISEPLGSLLVDAEQKYYILAQLIIDLVTYYNIDENAKKLISSHPGKVIFYTEHSQLKWICDVLIQRNLELELDKYTLLTKNPQQNVGDFISTDPTLRGVNQTNDIEEWVPELFKEKEYSDKLGKQQSYKKSKLRQSIKRAVFSDSLIILLSASAILTGASWLVIAIIAGCGVICAIAVTVGIFWKANHDINNYTQSLNIPNPTAEANKIYPKLGTQHELSSTTEIVGNLTSVENPESYKVTKSTGMQNITQ